MRGIYEIPGRGYGDDPTARVRVLGDRRPRARDDRDGRARGRGELHHAGSGSAGDADAVGEREDVRERTGERDAGERD